MQFSAHRPLVCVVVLNFNGREHLAYSLPSILATHYQPLQVVVVDNASSDDSVAYVRLAFPSVLLIESSVNRGWSGGNNVGIRQACELGAAYVVLANNDIRVDPRWVQIAVELADTNEQIGLIGFQILEPRGGPEDAGFSEAVARWHSLDVSQSRHVDGMALFVRTKLFAQLGMIDEGFFAYAEDNDFEWRARQAGYQVLCTNVPIWHRSQATFGRTPLRAAALQIRNNLRLALKHESIFGVCFQFVRHWAKACIPFLQIDRSDPIAARLRPSNIFVNFCIWLYAVLWNFTHLAETLRRRRADALSIVRTRQQLGLN